MSRDSIKMLAMLTMLLNHIANALLPAGAPLTNLFLCIGYFTAVTMCYFLVEGYGYTHSKRRYAGRLLGFAVLAQLPYQLAFPENGMAGFVQFNMLFTLLLCFLILLVQEKVSDPILRGAAIVLLICASLFCDWALLAPVFTLLFSWAGASRPRKKLAFVIAALLSRSADATPIRSPLISTMSADSMATSAPAPMAMPVSAFTSAGASFTPSPTIATV